MVSKKEIIEKEEVVILFDDALMDCIREFVMENEEALIAKFRREFKKQAQKYKMVLVTSRDKSIVKDWLEKNHLYKFIEYIL